MRISVEARGRMVSACIFSAIFAISVATKALGLEAMRTAALGSSSFDTERSGAARSANRHGSLKNSGAKSEPGVKRAEVNNHELPLFAVVSIADQRVSIYNHDGLVDRSAVSTGMLGHATPKGVFTIIGRERFHRSNIYSGAPMPFMQRITWSGIAMHVGVVPGHPASHGCIRLPAGFAAKLWGLTKIGERVVISPEEVTPIEFVSPLLPAPKMQVVAEADQAAPSTPQASLAATPPSSLINPHQYAEQLRAKAVAEKAAAGKTIKEMSAAVRVGQREAARAAAELKAAEAAYASAQAKAETAAKADQVVGSDVSASQQESILGAELKAADEIGAGRSVARRPAKPYEQMVGTTDTAAELADTAAKLEAATTASAAKAADLEDAVRQLNDATEAYGAATNAEKEAVRRMSPLSVLVSKKDQRIYVRQGLAPVFDAPVSVRDPATPLGSHLYIATAAENDGTSLKWSVVSIPTRSAEEWREHKRKAASGAEQVELPPKPRGSPSSAADALERIEIAKDVHDRIAERLWTGASLIISDQPVSGETGPVGTDLTVKVR
ncbi:L,D-transpeptidase family protein [Methylocapsa sp. D3K7]|uniref:L,D-transpeptidase family protein n=1 Tax=Methylocapsa sp. D3K7 TaxID=3041435 RepID=UPI00244ED3D4|nr:L,D-transpeptidase family protein [Methylocapsa sp. D3K7]WGJ16422.1 L,D-transpeptidase family protein [Methylocapsa sp. D3K7]